MTDRELLELAAKAAGIDAAVLAPDNDGSAGTWNPLTDDGDALRLAVRKRFHVNIFSANDSEGIETPGFVEVWHDGDDPLWVEYVEAGDYEAATRRAIVRAAAEIGARK